MLCCDKVDLPIFVLTLLGIYQPGGQVDQGFQFLENNPLFISLVDLILAIVGIEQVEGEARHVVEVGFTGSRQTLVGLFGRYIADQAA